MKRRLAATAAVLSAATVFLAGAAGCASSKKPVARTATFQSTSSIAYGTLAKREQADLKPAAPIKELAFVGDTLFTIAENNQVYALSKTLDLQYIQQIAAPGEIVRRPLLVGKEVVFPTATFLKFYGADGTNTRTIDLPHPMTSDIQLDPRGLILTGTAAPTGGRVTIVDPENARRPIQQETLIGTVTSAPVSFQGVVYAANDAGKVFAIGPENRSLWPLADMAFVTNRAVTANLAVDDYALYIPSTDTTLYAVDRTSGRIKWRYMGQAPLVTAPLLTKDLLFQVVPDVGIVALNKAEGDTYRQPLWTVRGGTKALGTDDKYLYAVVGKSKLVAVELATGETRLEVAGNFELFTLGANGVVYAATRGGNVVSFVRQPYRGDENVAAAR